MCITGSVLEITSFQVICSNSYNYLLQLFSSFSFIFPFPRHLYDTVFTVLLQLVFLVFLFFSVMLVENITLLTVVL